MDKKSFRNPPVAAEMPNRTNAADYKIDKLHNSQQFYFGYLTKCVDMPDGSVRSCKVYVPEGCRNDAALIAISVPDGVDTAKFLADEGWFDIADKNQVVLGIAEPGNGKWGTPEQELEYFHTVFTNHSGQSIRNTVNFDLFNRRHVGYGAGADAAEAFAMRFPLEVSAFVSVDTYGRLDSEFVKKTAETPFTAAETPVTPKNTVLDVKLGEAPVPVWFILDEPEKFSSEVLEYWKKANDVEPEPEKLANGLLWLQKPYSTRVITNELKVGQVRLTTRPEGDMAEQIFRHVMKFARAGLGSPYSNCLTASVDETRFIYESQIIDGYEREWCVYLPSYYKPEMKLPLVIYYHGTHQTCWSASRQGNWCKVAEARGFISVCASATLEQVRVRDMIPGNSWNCDDYGNADDIRFMHALVDHMQEKYNIDKGRVFCNGQSNGGRMTLFSALCMPDLFTAVASLGASSLSVGMGTSGKEFIPPEQTVSDIDIPVMCGFGGYDMQSCDLTDPDSEATYRSKYWCERYGMRFEDYYSRELGRVHIDLWHRGMTPMLGQYVTKYRAHNHRVEEQFLIWDEWFSKFSRADDGTLLYMGRKA